MIEKMEATGQWLFRWRSYLPIVPLVLCLAILYFAYPLASPRSDQAWELACLGVSLSGLLVRIATVGFTPSRTSGRNQRRQVADTLNTTGMYSIVRNPLYLANFFVGLGVSLFFRFWWVPGIYILLFMPYYKLIIFAEEMFLKRKFGELYANWAASTPAFLPRIRQWQPPTLPFNWKKVCRREYQTLFGIVMVFYLLALASEWRLGHALFADTVWNVIAAVALALFIVARLLNKLTSVLKDREPETANTRAQTTQ